MKRLAAEKKEQEDEKQRLWRIDFYSKQADLYNEELKSSSPNELVKRRNRETLERLKDEWEDREDARVRLQVEGHSPNKKVGLSTNLGIFAPERRDDAEEDLWVEELDAHDAHVFDAHPSSHYEDKMNLRNEQQSNVLQQEQLYQALQADLKELKDAIDRMHDVKDLLEKEQRQINQEVLAIEKAQLGPPRRMPMAQEIPATDLWKQRASQVMQKLRNVDYAIGKAEHRRKAAQSQSLTLAKAIAMAKQKVQKTDAALATENFGSGVALPMVIGKSLAKVDGMGVTALPKDMLDAVTQQSKFIAIKEGSDQALKFHKESQQIEREMWVERLKESGKRGELESMISRIARISEKLQRSKVDSLRLNIVDSLKAFLASGQKLIPLRKKIVGTLPWFKHHDFTLSSNVVPYVTTNNMGAIVFEDDEQRDANDGSGGGDESSSGGVTLGPDTMGYCSGVINLPKDSLWSLSVTITRQGRGPEYEHFDTSLDFVRVQLGPTLTSLSHIGTFHNRMNPATGTVLYDVKHIFRGNAFAFRFDFSASTTDIKKHLAVCTGIFEEYEMQDLELVSDPKNPFKHRILSSYVKMIRIEEASGGLRETRLLEELIDVENATTPHWDSQILTQTLQRFSREYFLRILKAEILLQQQQQRQLLLKKQKEAQAARGMMAGTDLERESRLEQSKKKYVTKKRQLERAKLDEARDLIGRRLVLWDKAESRWRNVKVLDHCVDWIENGLVAKITHSVQEYDDGFENIGAPLALDLSTFKYFHSPIQEIDPQSKARYREKKAWEDEIQRIEAKTRDEIARLERAVASFEKKVTKHVQRHRERVLQAMEATIDEEATAACKSSVGRREIKALLPGAMLDIKKGILLPDPDKTNKEIAKAAATERYKHRWMERHRRDVEQELQEHAERVWKDFAGKKRTIQRRIQQLRAETQAEVDVFKAKLRKLYFERRAAMKAQLTFPADVFQRVKPIAYNCEHLRTKAWGNLYEHGVRCLQCGKELNRLEEEESQLLGYGSGADRTLWLQTQRHTADEGTFRFTSQEELRKVEQERVRLEKERREMETNEVYFYDFDDLHVIYDFDHRHARTIKAAGVFRQGLQWTEEEVQYYEASKRARERERLEHEGLPETLLDEFDPLHEIEQPPPTFRAVDERHRAQFQDLLFHIGRLHNFRRRIYDYKMERFELLSQRDLYAAVLETLHRDSFVMEMELQDVEADLDRTSKLLATYDHMQRLWQQASLILHQAKKDKMRAEMARAGVWDDVQEQFDRVQLIHDQMRQLLKTKVLTEGTLQAYEQDVAMKTKRLQWTQEFFKKQHDVAVLLAYVKPGNLVRTRLFGMVVISAFRSRDDMVMVQLPFGTPPAMAFLYYRDVVDYEHSLQSNERKLMEAEDMAQQAMNQREREQCRHERRLMLQEETHNRQVYAFWDVGKQEDQQRTQSIALAVQEAYWITDSTRYQRLQHKKVRGLVNKMVQDRLQRRKDYIGPASGRPAAMSTYEIWQQRKAIAMELRHKFVEDAALAADQQIRQRMYQQRTLWIRDYQLRQLMDDVIRDMIVDLAAEAYDEGLRARHFVEKKTGVYFPDLLGQTHMQYHTYNDLATMWTGRKDELRAQIEMNKGQANKMMLLLDPVKAKRLAAAAGADGGDDVARGSAAGGADGVAGSDEAAKTKSKQELLQLKLKKRLRREELLRQQRLCAEMLAEEIRCREFYRWELKENLRERRLMKEEETLAQQLRKEEQRMRQEAEAAMSLLRSTATDASGGAGGVGGGGVGGANGNGGVQLNAALSAEIAARRDLQFAYERRRRELKELTLERRRRAEDQQLMALEDELSMLLREVDRMERQKKAYRDEYGEDDDEDDADADGAGDGAGGGAAAILDPAEREFFKGKELNLALLELSVSRKAMKPPAWLQLPAKFHTWPLLQRNLFIKRAIVVRHKQRQHARNLAKHMKRMEKLEAKSLKEWCSREKIASVAAMEAELMLMEAQESVYEAQAKLREIEENILKIRVFCRDKGEEELKARSEWKKREQLAKQRDAELAEATQWYDVCAMRAKNRDKLKRKVVLACKWIDTDSINGFHQRFATELLRERLYLTYFKRIVGSIVNRAEIIASERKMMSLQYALSVNKANLRDRVGKMSGVVREVRCMEWLRMKRSKLNESFFPKERLATLRGRFHGWIRYFYWNKGHTDAFKLKVEVIKRQMAIDRQFARQLQRPRPVEPAASTAMVVQAEKQLAASWRRMMKRSASATDAAKATTPATGDDRRRRGGPRGAAASSSAGTRRSGGGSGNGPTRDAAAIEHDDDDDDLGGTGDANDDDDDDVEALDDDDRFDDDGNVDGGNGTGATPPPPIDGLMQRVRERPLQCQHCLGFYLGAQNHAMACGYHPGRFLLVCPVTCTAPGLTALCATHRKRRWTCCLDAEAKAAGCARRYHQPPPQDPIYEHVLTAMQQRDAEMVAALDAQVTEARQQDYPSQVTRHKQQQLRDVEEKMEEIRGIARRFQDMKFV